MFYHFSQNNSGGFHKGPAIHVIIEADNADEANDRAEHEGMYFDGCALGLDCNCCGDRWYAAWADEGSETPMLYDMTPDAFLEREFYDWSKPGIPNILIVYKDGRRETR